MKGKKKKKKLVIQSDKYMKICLNNHKMKLFKKYLIPIIPKIPCSCKLKLEFRLITCPVVELTVNLSRKKILKYCERRRTMMH